MGSRLVHAYIGQRLIMLLPEIKPARFLLIERYEERTHPLSLGCVFSLFIF